MWFEDIIGVLRIAKMNVFSLVPQGFSHLFLDRVDRFQFGSRLEQHGVRVLLRWVASTEHGHVAELVSLAKPGALVDLL